MANHRLRPLPSRHVPHCLTLELHFLLSVVLVSWLGQVCLCAEWLRIKWFKWPRNRAMHRSLCCHKAVMGLLIKWFKWPRNRAMYRSLCCHKAAMGLRTKRPHNRPMYRSLTAINRILMALQQKSKKPAQQSEFPRIVKKWGSRISTASMPIWGDLTLKPKLLKLLMPFVTRFQLNMTSGYKERKLFLTAHSSNCSKAQQTQSCFTQSPAGFHAPH